MSAKSGSEYVSTAQVARALGLGVSTVKRWVDDGVLPALRTEGGHRRLRLSDVLEFAKRSNLSQAAIASLMGLPGSQHPTDYKSLAGTLHAALMKGDVASVGALIQSSHRGGLSIEELADQIIRPVMVRVGHDWETGQIDVFEEHRASELCASALYQVKTTLEESANANRPLAIGGAVEGDASTLPSLLAQMVLMEAGWNAVNLGSNTPFSSFEKAVDEMHPSLLWLSVSHLESQQTFLESYKRLYQHAERAGAAVVIGGRALPEALRCQLPYTTHGDRMAHLASFARTLNPRPRRPQRGRPPGS
jgi:excisionase family DNA binding protein